MGNNQVILRHVTWGPLIKSPTLDIGVFYMGLGTGRTVEISYPWEGVNVLSTHLGYLVLIDPILG